MLSANTRTSGQTQILGRTTTRLQVMVYSAFLTALSIIATRAFSIMIPIGGVGALRLGFGPVPIIMAGILFGPVWGGIVGLAADIVGFAINPMGGPFLPQITVISVLRGVIPGLIVKKRSRTGLADLSLAIGVTQVVLSIIITPLVLYQAFGIPIWVNIPLRLLTQAILIPCYVFITHLILRALSSFMGNSH